MVPFEAPAPGLAADRVAEDENVVEFRVAVAIVRPASFQFAQDQLVGHDLFGFVQALFAEAGAQQLGQGFALGGAHLLPGQSAVGRGREVPEGTFVVVEGQGRFFLLTFVERSQQGGSGLSHGGALHLFNGGGGCLFFLLGGHAGALREETGQ